MVARRSTDIHRLDRSFDDEVCFGAETLGLRIRRLAALSERLNAGSIPIRAAMMPRAPARLLSVVA
jgi:hypothetical protein